MAIDTIITSPSLRPLLQTTQSTLLQTLSILTWLESHTTSSPNNLSTPTLEAQLSLAQQQKLLYAHLAKLRGQNRRAAFNARATKQETAEARQEVDRLLLQLQNLYYEQRHLMGEIGGCEGYDHAYTHLPLLEREEYIALFPEQEDLEEEEMMPKRIDYEREEREKMDAERMELVKIKEDLAKENARGKEELRKIDEELEGMIEGLKPLEEILAKEI